MASRVISRVSHGFRVPCKASSGLTLIELMVAMAIVGLMFAVAAVGLRSALNVHLKNASAHLGATLRYLSNKAVTDHAYLRLTYDLDAQSYHADQGLEPFVISADVDETKEKEGQEEKPQKKEEEGEGEEEEKNTFTPVVSSALKPTKLPSGVLFKDVSVSYLKEKRERGQASTYFFPDGYATPTLINLKNEDDDDHYSIELNALSGKVRIQSEYREMEKQ